MYIYVAGSTEAGPRFDTQGTFLTHSVLGPANDYATELKKAGTVRLCYILVHVCCL